MAHSMTAAAFLAESRLADARRGDIDAFFDLGMMWATGLDGDAADLVQAHKWFNLAALSGSARAQECRAEVASEMSARQIAEAQRQARAWIAAGLRRAA